MRKLLIFTVVLYALVVGADVFFESTPDVNIFIDDSISREEAKTDEPAGFLNFHRGIRTQDGESGPRYKAGYKWNALNKALQTNMRMRSSGRSAASDVIEWKERGPANIPGRTRAIFNIPGDAAHKTWLAGAATGGIWRTDDGGSTWTERSANFPAMPISSFGADKNGTVIYAGTGELISSLYSAIGNGIFKSVDKGLSWVQLPSTNNHSDFSIITRLIVNPDNPNVIVATTAPHNTTTDNTSAIMRTVDGGLNWQKVKELEGIFEQIVFTPSNFNVQYASQNNVGVWKSSDAGMTWNLSNKGMVPSGRVEISVSPVNANVLYAASEGTLSGTNSDLYYSLDAGVNWSLVDIRFNDAAVDFFEGQGFYDNTILCDPFSSKSFYVGGVSLFKVTLTSGTTPVDNYKMIESGTGTFLFLQAFNTIPYDRERLNAGPNATKNKIEIRFGPGQTQKAHRFLVPTNRTNGVGVNEYTYQDYLDVPFEVWDATLNRQLMVSFRDQNRNGKFDLVPTYLTNDGIDYIQNSREYLYINDVTYSGVPNSNILLNGGHEYKLMFNVFPALAANAVWNVSTLPASKIAIEFAGINKFNASTVTVADGRGSFDSKNRSNQVEPSRGVHPDHHCITAIITDTSLRYYKLLIGNDGGVFESKISSNPGTNEGDWQFRGFGLNTGQFYGADKSPIAEHYIGGMQDNGTRMSPKKEVANAKSLYFYALDGDGFEVIWNSTDASKLLATRYYGQVAKSVNGGISWRTSNDGSTENFPFVTKLANNKDFPDRVFTASRQGVYKTENFGDTWQLTPIPTKFVIGSALFLDVEVSRANANIVWAGSGMNEVELIRNIHLSTDGGKTFQPTTNYNDRKLGNITKLASHPIEQNTAYALFSFANSPKILRTTNLGVSWEDITGFGAGTTSLNGFPDVAVYCLYVRADNPDILWAGTEIGIVESINNGISWSLLDDFPHVSVWDMKGQNDEVVIATHGRGIWTAKIANQQSGITTAKIVATGSSPQGNFVIRITGEETFDSVKVFINSTQAKKLMNFVPQTIDISFTNQAPGSKEIKLVAYKQGIPFQSMVVNTVHHTILSPKTSYSTFFNSLDDLTLNGMSLQFLEGTAPGYAKSLQTNHSYSANENYEILIRTPVTISDVLPTIFFEDIAIVEPGQDYVVVEGTTNGLDWIPLTSYDATINETWHAAFTNNKKGNNSMFMKHEIDLSSFFSSGQLALFRFRLLSNSSITSWGWAVEQISIQEIPTAVENPILSSMEVFPNPTRDRVHLKYFLRKPGEISIDVVNIFGTSLHTFRAGLQINGLHEEVIDFKEKPVGVYFIILHTAEGPVTKKIIRD